MIYINPSVFLSAGFREIKSGETIDAVFFLIQVFDIQGIHLSKGDQLILNGKVDGVGYTLGVGYSINDICQAMLGDNYVDNDEQWIGKNKCTGTILVVHFGPTISHICKEGLIKHTDDIIETYSCFSGAASELKSIRLRIMPRIITSLELELASPKHSLTIKEIERTMYGKTPSGEIIYDFRIETSGAKITTSSSLPIQELTSHVAGAISIAPKMIPESAHFFNLARIEDDSLKKFLFFFLSIEIAVNTSYKVGRIKLRDHAKSTNSIKQRFEWCAHNIWTGITTHEVEQFGILKHVRNEIAHGDTHLVLPDAILSAQSLARKILIASLM